MKQDRDRPTLFGVGAMTVVLLEAIVDTVGRVEPSSIRILASPSPGFDEPTRRWAASARFRPARLDGRAVRVLVNLPIDFATTSGG